MTTRISRCAPGSAALGAMTLVALGAVAWSCDDPERDPSAEPTVAAPTSPSPTPPPPPTSTEVTCPNGKPPRTGVTDPVLYDDFTDMLTGHGDDFVVDRSTRTIFRLRADGTIRSATTYAGDPDGPWGAERIVYCVGDNGGHGGGLALPGRPMTLRVGHCWIEPVAFEGESWDVVAEDQFGGGGGTPQGFVGTGSAARHGDVVSYLDASGHRLTLVPEGDPWALERGGCD